MFLQPDLEHPALPRGGIASPQSRRDARLTPALKATAIPGLIPSNSLTLRLALAIDWHPMVRPVSQSGHGPGHGHRQRPAKSPAAELGLPGQFQIFQPIEQ